MVFIILGNVGAFDEEEFRHRRDEMDKVFLRRAYPTVAEAYLTCISQKEPVAMPRAWVLNFGH